LPAIRCDWSIGWYFCIELILSATVMNREIVAQSRREEARGPAHILPASDR
jgi:hypothetical protein